MIGHLSAARITVTGVVQGVGFRPHLARLAGELGVAGHCHNDETCVLVDVEGDPRAIAEFTRRVRTDAPPLAVVDSVTTTPIAATGATSFTITSSRSSSGARTMVPPDAATCQDCLAEMRDPGDRRFQHPFITCTHCGPRFTITEDLPYDRPQTTMRDFAMCTECAAEYADPTDRRFHAQPISCHVCGPRLRFGRFDTLDRPADTDPGARGVDARPADDAAASIEAAVRALLAGDILAVKGIGGFHLVCLADDDHVVQRLRERKHRPHQPFAVMLANTDQVGEVVELTPAAAGSLTSTARPILLLPKRSTGAVGVAEAVAPGLGDLGVMVPYTGLHHLLFDHLGALAGPRALVVTSANVSGEPLIHRDEDLVLLADLADGFVTHNRAIAVPCDDSVIRWGESGPTPIRRSRGYAPAALPLPDLPVSDLPPSDPIAPAGPTDNTPQLTSPVVFAVGSELKNTFALARDSKVWLSGHLGDLSGLGSRRSFRAATDQMLRFHRVAPDLVVCDLHPGYASRAWAVEFADQVGVELLGVQHHHAHLASVAAEHERLDEPILGLVLDGTGYGCDGGIWGGELLLLSDQGRTCDRWGHLADLPLPGGDAGVRNPVRVAAATATRWGINVDRTPVHDELTEPERALFGTDRDWPVTSSAGRLFDVVAALLGIRPRISYEAQAAVELEARAAAHTGPVPDLGRAWITDDLVLDPSTWLHRLADLVRAGTPVDALALAFHRCLARGLVDLAAAASSRTGVTTVGLSGGVFANRILTDEVSAGLASAGLTVLTHRAVPPGDGGLSLGQAAVGWAHLSAGSPTTELTPERKE